MNYRTKIIRINAVQWKGNNVNEVDNLSKYVGEVTTESISDEVMHVSTLYLRGKPVSLLDYVYLGKDGYLHSARKEVFEKLFVELD